MMGSWPVRRRTIVTMLCALVATAGLILIAVIYRPEASPVLATLAVGPSAGLPSIGVDEEAGRAYVVARPGGLGGAGAVRVLDTVSGAVVGTTTLPGQNGGQVAVAVDVRRGRAYAASSGSTSCSPTGGGSQTCATIGAALVVLDARTGRPLRSLPVDAGRALAVDERTGLLYILPSAGGTTPGGTMLLRALDPLSGRVVRTIVLPGDGRGFGFATLAIDERGRRLVVARTLFSPRGGPVGSADIVDVASGRLLRHLSLPGAGFVSLYHPPLIDGARGRAYVASGGYGNGAGVVVILDTRRGALLRTVATGSGLGDIAEDARTGRVFTTALGALRTVTTRTQGGTSTTSMPAGVGSLRVLDVRGALLQSLSIGVGTTDVAVDERRGRVYALSFGPADAHGGLTRPGALSVVDERSGQVVRTIATGTVPIALALDRRHDRLLVGCIGAFGGTPDDPWGWVPGPVRRLLPFLPRPPSPIRTPQGSVMILDTTRL